jgi:hypothetical protein
MHHCLHLEIVKARKEDKGKDDQYENRPEIQLENKSLFVFAVHL